MKALVLAPFTPSALDALRARMPVLYEPWTETRRLQDPDALAERVRREGISVLVVEADFVFGPVLDASPPLQLVAVCRADLNTVDLDTATERGVAVVHTPGRTAQGVAELALALMLALARRLGEADRLVRAGGWQDPVSPYLDLRGVELAGRTLGVVGLGAIGRRVARLGRALGMRVLGYDPFAPVPRGVLPRDLDALLAEGDFVSLHAPPSAGCLLSAERLARMRPGAFLVNTASSALVDTNALVDALRSGRLAGAGLDTVEPQPLPPGHPLLSLPNVLITPHIGGATDGTVARHSAMAVEDILRFLEGRRPRRLANPAVWRRRAR